MQRKQFRLIGTGEKEWECPTCKRWLFESQFYQSKKTWNGLGSQCRNCHIRGSIKTRDNEIKKKTNRESARRLRLKNPEKFKARERDASKKRIKDIRFYARQMVHCALKTGMLERPLKCQECNKFKKITAHHPDYTKPLNVEWLCYECHGNR